MLDKKERSLVAIYQAMDSAQIERRLASGELTELAKGLAQEELGRRAKDMLATTTSNTFPPERSGYEVLWILVPAMLTGLLSYWLLPIEMSAVVIALVVLPIMATSLGKLFPKVGLVLGVLLVASPIGMTWWMWHIGALHWQSGDYKPLGTILAYVALVIASTIVLAVGCSMIAGALHKGSWRDLKNKLATQSDDALSKVSRLK